MPLLTAQLFTRSQLFLEVIHQSPFSSTTLTVQRPRGQPVPRVQRTVPGIGQQLPALVHHLTLTLAATVGDKLCTPLVGGSTSESCVSRAAAGREMRLEHRKGGCLF